MTGRSVPPGAVGRADHGLDGPYGDDLVIGTPLPSAPPITIDAGVAAAYQTIVGDPLRLALSDPVSRQVTGRTQRLVNPALVLHMAIGQSTVATRLVIANLFYRDVVLRRQLHVGDTVTTLVTPVARALTRPGPAGRRAKVLLEIETRDQDDAVVCRFQRLALLPCRDAGSTSEVGEVGSADPSAPLTEFRPGVPAWDLAAFAAPAASTDGAWVDPQADTVTAAVELVRLTQNVAFAHRDPRRGQAGRRLVYGGHTIGLAQASLTRTCPAVVTILGWRSCDHLAPVFEGDVLAFDHEVVDRLEHDAHSDIVGFRVRALLVQRAHGSTPEEPTPVLDWRPVALVRRPGDGPTHRKDDR